MTIVTVAVAAAIVVRGVMEIARARIDSGPGATGTEAAEGAPASSPGTRPTATPGETQPTAAPPGTRLYSEVFSVSDAVLHRGTWFVLDRRGSQVHRFDESGALLGSFGSRGEGPGEFRRPVAIASHEGAVIVLDGGILHYHDMEGRHLEDRRVPRGSCADWAVRDLLSQPTGLLLLADCSEAGQMGWSVVLEHEDGTLRTLAFRASDLGVLDLRMARAVLGAHPMGFVFGFADDDCLDLFDPSGTALGDVCHDWIERLPIPREAEDQMADLRARAGQTGIRLIEPNLLPPFAQVFPVRGALAYQVPLPEDLETFRLFQRGSSGAAVALPLPVAEGMFGAGSSVLLWWEDTEGVRIAIRHLDAP